MNIAVVGASNDPEKYGNRIVRHLVDAGHTVYPVNLKEKTILEIPAFTSIVGISDNVDIIDIVVPPSVTLKILKDARKLKKPNVWIQPGAESKEVIEFLKKNKDDFGRVTYNDCIMTSLDSVYEV